jgi:hypothetical protein
VITKTIKIIASFLDLEIELENMTQVLVDEDVEETVTHLMDILFNHKNWDLGLLGTI